MIDEAYMKRTQLVGLRTDAHDKQEEQKMAYDFIQVLEDLLQAIKLRKIDDGLDGDKRRRWAIAYSLTEQLYAYFKTYLVEEQ